MKIGFIGCGNMATAIINGLLNNKLLGSNDIYIYDKYQCAIDRLVNELNVIGCENQKDVTERCDVLFLAVKPNVIGSVISEIKTNSPLVISIAAGKTIEYLESFENVDLRLVRVMPNINAKVGEAISAYCYNENVLESDIDKVESILSCFGKCLYIDESQFPIFGVLGGCAPAYAYMFIDSLAQAGVDNGMMKDEALKIAAQTVYGSAKMILETDVEPWRLADNVCSPGGTTIEGVISLQKDEFNKTIKRAVNKSFEKDKLL